MRVALIDIIEASNDRDRENIGLGTIASYLRAHEIYVKLITITVGSPLIFSKIFEDELFDSVGLTMYSRTAKTVYAVAQLIKENASTSVFVGGRLASSASEIILQECKYLDFVVLG